MRRHTPEERAAMEADGWTFEGQPADESAGCINLEPLGDGRLQITICDDGESALLTVRGKDHDVTRADLLAIARDCLAVAARMPAAPPVDAAEITAFPWWMIIDPRQMMRPSVQDVSSMVTGPFLSREAADEWMERVPHRFTSRARVYCASGYASVEWRALCASPEVTDRQAGNPEEDAP